MFLSLNGVLTDRASVDAVSSAALYGKGVFTTIAIRNAEPILWEKHWSRLTSNASSLSIDTSEHSEQKTFEALRELIAASGLASGRARVSLLDRSPSRIWQASRENGTDLLIIAAEDRLRSDGLRITVSGHSLNSNSPLAGVKSCNYLEHLIAFEEAGRRGFDEAVRLNEKGHVASACMANVFWETGGKLYTPSLSTGCLAGTTREFVLENLGCEELEAGIEAIERASRIFLTSAGLGVAPVAEFNGRRLDTSEHEILTVWPD